MKQLLIILSIFIGLNSCDPCSDCGNPLVYDPNVLATFINYDSLMGLDRVVDTLNGTKSGYSSIKSSLTSKIKSLGDSIKKYTDSVTNGKSEYQSLVDLYTNERKVFSDSTTVIDSLSLDVSDSLAILNKIKTKITSGKLVVDTIRLIETGRYNAFSDSTTKYSLSLLIGATETSYEIKIKEKTLHVSFTYTTEEYVDEVQRLIKIRANDIEPTSDDSIQYLEDEGRIIFYF